LRVLVDTQAALWWLSDDPKLSETAADAISDPANEVLLSAVVVWEVAIKRAIGKLKAPDNFAFELVMAGMTPLPIDINHAARVEFLPMHHRDPFDRLLIAQAEIEGAAIVSGDAQFRDYDPQVIW
jgi:PIN domain nuclease of toxin-antitoxin system